jgi:hypothetical protein
VPKLPCPGGLSGWVQKAQTDEELCRLWDNLLAKPFEETFDVQQKLLERARQEKRSQAVASRKHRRERIEALGDAVPPPMGEYLGRKIIECDQN